MGAFLSMPFAPWALFAVLAGTLFAAGHLRARKRHATPALVPARQAGTMMPMMEAAAAAYKAAKRERMVIRTVAERAGDADPVGWFAKSIAGVVPAYRKTDSGAFEKIEGAASVGTEAKLLYIRRHSYQTYLGWARSMQ